VASGGRQRWNRRRKLEMLELRFSTQAGRIQLSCDQDSTRHLQAMRGWFPTAASINVQAFDVDIDDLLVNLRELARWPSADQEVTWQPELLALVESNASDAGVLERRLATVAGEDPPTLTAIDGWEAPLTDFQERDVAKLLELSHGANFSVPGAGKTRVALAAFQARRAAGEVERMLVVCPKSAFESWQTEASLCFPNGIHVAVMDTALAPSCDVLLVNYERLLDARSALLTWLRVHPAMLVLDEAHRMKLGPAGAWGSACLSLGPYAHRRLILSGTPAPNGARDLENLFAFVWPGQGRSAVSRAVGTGDLRAASQALRPLFVRTTKSELQLPEVQVAVRRVDLPPLHRELYNALLGQASGRWRGGEQDAEALGRILLYLLMAATTPALLATGASRYEPLPYRVPPLQPAAGSSLSELLRDLPHYELSPKYQEVLAIVAQNAEAGRKTLVWSTFVRNLTSLEHLLASYSPALVHGGTEDRKEQLARFRQDPNCMVLLSNPATLGEGVSLHHDCHDAVYVDRDFAAGRFLQSVDRIHRLGLAPDVETRVTVLVSSETVDELVEQRLAAKLRFMGGILDDPAVLELGDLDEEPTASVGMDSTDLRALVGYLSAAAAVASAPS
jgi:SNF2 family DNA or RNA helicase